jgi:hypothetical protein
MPLLFTPGGGIVGNRRNSRGRNTPYCSTVPLLFRELWGTVKGAVLFYFSLYIYIYSTIPTPVHTHTRAYAYARGIVRERGGNGNSRTVSQIPPITRRPDA